MHRTSRHELLMVYPTLVLTHLNVRISEQIIVPAGVLDAFAHGGRLCFQLKKIFSYD